MRQVEFIRTDECGGRRIVGELRFYGLATRNPDGGYRLPIGEGTARIEGALDPVDQVGADLQRVASDLQNGFVIGRVGALEWRVNN